MATSPIGGVIQHLRRILREGVGLTDEQLLEDYISHHDDAAFAALVRRHGSMVWGVCRRVLHNHHDAEDAFQATFLVFVRRAASIASRKLLANWLYGVAYQTALKARATAAKRKGRERQVTDMPQTAVAQPGERRDLRALLDQELSRLPDKYRAVIVLCDLESKTRKEAAGQLGCAEGTVASRLARARVMLAKRLTQRGVAFSGGALAAVLAQQAASAGAPSWLVDSTIEAASLLAAGKAATAAVSVQVAALTEGVLKAMVLTKIKTVTLGLLLLAAAVWAPAGLIFRTQAAHHPHEQSGLEEPISDKGNTEATVTVELLAHKDVKVASLKAVMSAVEKTEGIKANVSFSVQEADGISARIHASPDLPLGSLVQVTKALKKTGVGTITIVTNKGDELPLQTITGEADKAAMAWGKEVDGLQAGIRLKAIEVLGAANRWEVVRAPMGKIHQGSVIRFEVIVRNVSKQPARLKYIQPSGWPCSEDERRLKFASAFIDSKPILHPKTLQPGESWEVAQLNITTRKPKPTESFSGLVLLELGKYRVSCHGVLMQVTANKLATGELEIDIVPARVENPGEGEGRQEDEMSAAPAAAQSLSWADKMFKGTTTHDFGGVPRGAQLYRRFPMTNIWAVPIEIMNVHTSCGCVTATPSAKILQPRETGYLDVTMDSRRFTGHKSASVYIMVGPQYISTATVRVWANSRADVAFKPGQVNFGVVPRGQTPAQTIDVEYTGDLDWRVSEVIKNTMPVDVTLQELYRRPGQVGYRVRTTLKADAPPGLLKQELLLKTNDPASPLVPVLVEATVQAPLTVVPATVNLGSRTVGEEASRKVFVRAGKPFRITAIEGLGDGIDVEIPAATSDAQILILKYHPTQAGSLRRRLTIRTDLEQGATATVKVEGSATAP
jgi:RNA polymerase sigma factor (sigma-70 family)